VSKFTPGPWTFIPDLCNEVVRARGCIIAEVTPQLGISKANAHLIAAAPEMHEALIQAKGFIENALAGGSYNTHDIQRVLSASRIALAKADGAQ